MESTTPTSAPPRGRYRPRSTSRTRNGQSISRPTTPLRAASRTSLRLSTTTPTTTSAAHPPNSNSDLSSSNNHNPLDILEPAFAEFSDSMADLEANMLHLQLLQDSLGRFNENFAAFLYGLNMSAFTVDFTEAPSAESYTRAKDMAERQRQGQAMFGVAGGAQAGGAAASAAAAGTGGGAGLGGGLGNRDVDATFLTTDTSFVENPPTPRTTTSSRSSRMPPPSSVPASARSTSAIGRGGRGGIVRGGASTSSARGRAPPVVRGTRATQMAASRRETLAAARGRGDSSGLR